MEDDIEDTRSDNNHSTKNSFVDENEVNQLGSPLLGCEAEEVVTNINHKKRLINFSDSDENSNESNFKLNNGTKSAPITTNKVLSSDDDDDNLINFNLKTKKSRIQNMSSSDEDDNSPSSKKEVPGSAMKHIEHQNRMTNKSNKIKDKFKDLTKSREKHVAKSDSENSGNEAFTLNDSNKSSNNSSENEEISSIDKIKQKIKERNIALKSKILYDPDTSDEDDKSNKKVRKTKRKSMQRTSPKPVRMSAKQAMDNMQKIKSESNRMLREKEVSLPYHRPKALALKDILNRRKPAVNSDGKALPLKMNDEQLKLYAQSLEQRQKEMMELCKSDTEDEEDSLENRITQDHDKNKENCENFDNNKDDHEDTDETCKLDINKDNIASKSNNKENIMDLNKIDQPSLNDDKSPVNNTIVTDTFNIDSNPQDENDMSYDNLIQANTIETSKYAEIADKNMTEKEPESQLISLHYDSEKIDTITVTDPHIDKDHEKDNENEMLPKEVENSQEPSTSKENNDFDDEIHNFSDNDIDMEDIDRMIETADIIESQSVDSPLLIRDSYRLNAKPKLTGAPGTVIDLDGNDATHSNKISGVELLKRRFTYFNQLKTPKEMEKATQQKIKPGTQHLRLKQELEEQMAEQRSLEWAKRLEEEKIQRQEMNALRGDESDEDEIDKIEAKLAESDNLGIQENEVSTESEPEEYDVVLEDKARKKSAFVADEAEESDCGDDDNKQEEAADEKLGDDDEQNEADNESDDESSDEESTDDEDNIETKQRKGRILKAFEDSDEEQDVTEGVKNKVGDVEKGSDERISDNFLSNKDHQNSQDDELQSAQLQKSYSDDLFNSQDNDLKSEKQPEKPSEFAALNYNKLSSNEVTVTKNSSNLPVICDTQPYDDAKFDDIAGMCSGSFSQNVIRTQTQVEPSSHSETQDLGDDVLALCTGKFYDNEFISQQKADSASINKVEMQEKILENNPKIMSEDNKDNEVKSTEKIDDGNLLKSILLELDDPEFESSRTNRYFNDSTKGESVIQQKKRFVIESDDEAEGQEVVENKKKRKKKKLQDRALQISDDEEEISEEENDDDVASDLEVNDAERLVEYDSEENEVVIEQQRIQKKVKRKTAEFFENEAELTSEDEWVGSGDEDEAGLDRMEREAGDDDQFHQGKLQRELGQIHMRDVLDQDKREVRMIQELLFEDGDLGDGHRQRKFRWKNAEGDIEGAAHDLTGTQEEEFESEEQWRKQRHERETFLRKMQQEGNENEPLNTSITRTAIIKANLSSRTMSSLLMEMNSPKDKLENTVEKEKIAKDIVSPTKKAFPTLLHNYRGSLLSRGTNALARLAAIATPLAGEGNENGPKIGALKSGKGNFVFAAVSPTPDEPKVHKRKKDSNIGTPQLMKKIKTDEKSVRSKKSLINLIN